MPFFSLIIPACGCEAFLPRLFVSLEAQTCRGFEVLLAVEESQDNSLKMCRQWCDKQQASSDGIPTQVLPLPRTGAGGASRNCCYRHAIGEYLVPLDGDDWLEDNALEILAGHIKKCHPQVLLGSAKVWLQEAGSGELTPTSELLSNLPAEQDGAVMDGVELIHNVARRGIHFKNHGALVVVERDFLLKNNLFQLEATPSEDSDWTPRVLLAAKSIVFVGTPYYNYRRREGSVSSSGDARILQATGRIALRLAETLRSLDIPEDVRRIVANDAISLFNWYLFNRLYAKRFSRKDRCDALRMMREENADALRWLYSCTSRSKRLGFPLIMLATKTGFLLPATLYYRYLYYPLSRLK